MEESKTECMILSSIEELENVNFDTNYTLAVDDGLEIEKIVSSQTYVSDIKFDTLDKKTTLTAKLTTKLVILDKMGVYVTASGSSTCTHTIADQQIVDNGTLFLRNIVSHTNCKLNNSVIEVSVSVFANLVQYSKTNHCVVSKMGEDVYCKTEDLPLMQTQQLIDAGFNAECELEIKDSISKILSTDVRFVQTDVCTLENAVSVSGQLMVDVLYCVENDEGSQVKSVCDSCAVKGEVEASGVDMECIADVTSYVDNTKTLVNTTINDDHTTLNVETFVNVNGGVFKVSINPTIVDLYSIKTNMQPNISEKKLMFAETISSFGESISGEVACEDLVPDEIVSVCGNRVNIVRKTLSQDEIVFEGVCEGQILYRAEEGSIVTKSYAIPFQSKHELDPAQYNGCQLSTSIENVKAKIRRADLITIDIDLKISAVAYREENRFFVTDVNVGDAIDFGTAAYQIFIGQTGEDLWDVCKRIKVDATQLMLLNPNLELPCKGGERIFVQR